jgi:DNA-binding transcriptional LysR family regulator
VVAEYQSIQKAAEVLSVSASALSRTVRLLEDAVDARLFVRSATGLALTPFGADLLSGTRDAMRRIDDVLAERGSDASRVFAVGASGAFLPRLLDVALTTVIASHSGVAYRTTPVDDEDMVVELLRGNIDVVVADSTHGFEHPAEVTSVAIGVVEFALMAPSTHPDFHAGLTSSIVDPAAKTVTLMHVAAHEHAASTVVAVARSMESAERIAEHGPFLALLPPALASSSFVAVAPSPVRVPVMALFRTPLSPSPPALVRSLIAALSDAIARPR